MTESASRGAPGRIKASLRDTLSIHNIVSMVAGLALIIVAGIVAPGDTPGAWVWTRLLLAAAFAVAGIVLIALPPRGANGTHGMGRQPFIAIGCLFVTVVLSLTFNILTALFAVITLVLILLHLNARGPSSTFVFWSLIGMLVPFWVWSAFEAWDRWLLMLLAPGVVGMISLEHALRSDLFRDDETERYATWIGVLLMSAVWLIAGLAIDMELWWLIAGAAIAVVLCVLDLLPARRAFGDTLPAFTLPGLALAALMFAWLIAL